MQEPTISTKPIAVPTRVGLRARVFRSSRDFSSKIFAKVPLEPWERTGGLAARICLEGTGETTDAYVCEIPAGRGAWLFLPPTGFTSISIQVQNRCAI